MRAVPAADRRPVTPLARSWRVTTATRAFALALAAGQVLSAGALDSLGITLLAVTLINLVASAMELDPRLGSITWAPVVEGLLISVVIGTSAGSVEPLLVLLVVPPVVAGIRHGWVASANTSLASGATMLAVWTAAEPLSAPHDQAAAAIPWLAIGLGTGLLSGWLTRSIRTLEASQAPYAAAHRLVSQLHTLSHQLPMGLDSTTMAERLLDEIRGIAATEHASVLVVSGAALEPLAARPQGKPSGNEAARACIEQGRVVQTAEATALPLRVGVRHFGVVLLQSSPQPSKAQLTELQHLLDDRALRLDTALLFDEVRALATAEERSRLARDIHDGVAQEIASLGYLVDELAEGTDNDETRRMAVELRREVTRVVSELRLSIFDLRHDRAAAGGLSGGLSGALAEYVHAASAHSDLRVHLLLDERGGPLSLRTEGELLRIAQEAIANVRKHAHAINLWVTLSTDAGKVLLKVEDDGVGVAVPRPGHYGLHTMRERADRIQADLMLTARPDGGTVVTVLTRTPAPLPEGDSHDDSRPARR